MPWREWPTIGHTPRRGWGVPPSDVSKAASFQQLEGNERKAADVTDVENLDDVGMSLLRNGLCLNLEPCQILGLCETTRANHLQGDEAAQSVLVRLIDDAHAAVTKLCQDLITLNRRKLGVAGALAR